MSVRTSDAKPGREPDTEDLLFNKTILTNSILLHRACETIARQTPKRILQVDGSFGTAKSRWKSTNNTHTDKPGCPNQCPHAPGFLALDEQGKVLFPYCTCILRLSWKM